MKELDLLKLKNQLRDERNRDLDLIEKAFQAKLRALSVLKDLRVADLMPTAPSTSGPATIPGFSSGVPILSEPTRPRTGELKETVAALIPRLPAEFTVGDVVSRLKVESPGLEAKVSPASFSNVLIRLAEDGTYGFTLKQRGKGKRASVYRKTEAAPDGR